MARRGRPRTRRVSRPRSSKVILVKVARTGGEVTEVALNGDTGRTVKAALEAADISVSRGQTIRVNGRSATLSSALRNGSIVTVAGRIRWGR